MGKTLEDFSPDEKIKFLSREYHGVEVYAKTSEKPIEELDKRQVYIENLLAFRAGCIANGENRE